MFTVYADLSKKRVSFMIWRQCFQTILDVGRYFDSSSQNICIVFLLCNVVLKAIYLTLPYRRQVRLAIQPGSSHDLFLECPVPSQEYGSFYQIDRFYVHWRLILLQLYVSVVPLFSSYCWCVLSVIGCDLGFFSLNWPLNSGILLLLYLCYTMSPS